MMTGDNPYETFTLATPVRARRQLTVSELVKHRPGYEWAAILSNAYLTKEGLDVSIVSFDQLLGQVSGDRAISCLDEIRRSGHLTEGTKNLSASIIGCMTQEGKRPFFMRALGSSEPKQITEQQMVQGMSDIVGVLANEIELCDSGSTWYLRLRDDDPLGFLYADVVLLDEIEKKSPGSSLRLSANFVYAY